MAFSKPHIGDGPEQLMAIEKHLEKVYDVDKNNGLPERELREDSWLVQCVTRGAIATGGKANLKWFVPLCGKSPAMKWFYERGDEVIGVELAGKAIEQFFDSMDMNYTKSDLPLQFGCLYQNDDKQIKIFKCNIFDVTRDLIGGPVDAIWDRGSMQAIDHHERERYGEILLSVLKPGGKILAQTYELDQGHNRPCPLSVNAADFTKLYGERCNVEILGTEPWEDFTDTMRLVSLK